MSECQEAVGTDGGVLVSSSTESAIDGEEECGGAAADAGFEQ